MPRLFTALEIRRNAAMSLSWLRGGLPGARWIDVEELPHHAPLIGDVDWRTADEIIDRLTASNGPSFSCSCRAPAPSVPRNRTPSGPASAWLPKCSPFSRNRAHLPAHMGCPRIRESSPRMLTLGAPALLARRGCRRISLRPVISSPLPSPSPASCSCRTRFGRRRPLFYGRGLPLHEERLEPREQ